MGLAIILLTAWIIFFFRQRRQRNLIEDETLLGEEYVARIRRPDLRDEDDEPSASSSGEILAVPMADPHNGRYAEENQDPVHQYPDFVRLMRTSRDEYSVPPSPHAATRPHIATPPTAFTQYRDRTSIASDGMSMREVSQNLALSGAAAGIAHTHGRSSHYPHHSRGTSYEPLLASQQWRRSRSSYSGSVPPSPALAPAFGPISPVSTFPKPMSVASINGNGNSNGRRISDGYYTNGNENGNGNGAGPGPQPPLTELGPLPSDGDARKSPSPHETLRTIFRAAGHQDPYIPHATGWSGPFVDKEEEEDRSPLASSTFLNHGADGKQTRRDHEADAASSITDGDDLPKPVLAVGVLFSHRNQLFTHTSV